MSDKGWRPGFTVGTSEGKWSKVESGNMKYERRDPITYGSPDSDAWRSGYERLFGPKREEFCAAGHRLAWCECKTAEADNA